MHYLLCFLTIFAFQKAPQAAPPLNLTAVQLADYFEVPVGQAIHLVQQTPQGKVDLKVSTVAHRKKGEFTLVIQEVEIPGQALQHYFLKFNQHACYRAPFNGGAFLAARGPLKKGTNWQWGGKKFTVEAVNKEVQFPAGKYKCLLVKDSAGITYYYGQQLGLVRVVVPKEVTKGEADLLLIDLKKVEKK